MFEVKRLVSTFEVKHVGVSRDVRSQREGRLQPGFKVHPDPSTQHTMGLGGGGKVQGL